MMKYEAKILEIEERVAKTQTRAKMLNGINSDLPILKSEGDAKKKYLKISNERTNSGDEQEQDIVKRAKEYSKWKEFTW